MKTNEAESLQLALNDKGLTLKNLDVESYMKTIKLIKRLSVFLDERLVDIQNLVKEYNKEFLEKIVSEPYKKAISKKEEDRSTEENDIVAVKPAVTEPRPGILSGPQDFIDKVSAINKRELKLKKEELNFIKDSKVFKSIVDGTSIANQSVLYDFLFKQ